MGRASVAAGKVGLEEKSSSRLFARIIIEEKLP